MLDQKLIQTLLKGALLNFKGTLLEAMLHSAGHLVDRADEAMEYVLMVVFDKAGANVVGLLKMKGPAKLLGKVTFPGGRLEEGETLEAACSREMLEESAVTVPVEAWKFVCRNQNMAVFTAVLDSVSDARTVEMEPVFTLKVKAHLDGASFRNELYADDFPAVLQMAMLVAGLEVDVRLLRLSVLFKTDFTHHGTPIAETAVEAGARYAREKLASTDNRDAVIDFLLAQTSQDADFDLFEYGIRNGIAELT